MEDLKKICSKKLKELKSNLTAQDKLDAMTELKISRPTLEKYLKGKAVNIELATNLIQFFTNRINGRLAELQGCVAENGEQI